LDPEAFTLLVFGGSQGARALNARILEALPALIRDRPGWQYIHLTGVREEEPLRAAYAKLPCRVFVRGFHSDMATLYSAADFVVGRAGANTVMELKRMGRAALLVPFPFATDQHQLSNARVLEREGQATVLEEKSMTAQSLGDLLRSLPEARVLREEAGERVGRVSQNLTDAAARVADLVEEAVV
jgi:UDP-N-acetylglucosamine--N-acetylmuramyl-(pentapeptide) pyrophosphoryl-undecaprenol N-acetylglucosamine transferase